MSLSNDDDMDLADRMLLAKPKFLKSIHGGGDNASVASMPLTTANGGKCNETPIFSKREMTLRIPKEYNGNLTHLVVCKNWMVCLLAAPPPSSQVTLFRFFLPRVMPPGEISLEKYLAGYKIGKLFLDYTGHHILVSLIPKSPGLSADFLYIHGNGRKVRRIEKFKDHEITSVAFNYDLGNESTTGPILLGTSKGLIFETELTLEADKPLYRKQVYDVGLGRPKYDVTGLEFRHVPNAPNQYIVVATATDCILTFQGNLRTEERTLQPIFNGYINGTQSHGYEVAKTDMKYSVLQLNGEPNEKYPKQWGWLCGSGLRHGEVAQSSIKDEKFLLEDHLIPLDKDLEQRKHLSYEEKRLNVPKAFVLTAYHVLLMYHDHVTGICLLDQSIVYEEYFTEKSGKLLNIHKDPFTGVIYLCAEKKVFNFKVDEERRNIWCIYLNMGIYDMAEIHAANDEENLDTVLKSKAQALFDDKKYEEAAKIYAETQMPFEEVCLKFIDLREKRPIITYVQKRLETLSPEADEQLFVLVAWLIDLYLTEINYPGRSKEEKHKWQVEYDEFMLNFSVIKCYRANRTAIQDLITQHADDHNLAQFAIANEDYDEVLQQHIEAEKYLQALHILQQQKNIELYYKYCPTLIEYLPKETIELMMSQGRKLNVQKLIPTITTIDSPVHIAEITKYLEYCIYNLGETYQAIHNFLLRLYAEHQPGKVMEYLKNEGQDITLVHYDVNYALLMCMDFGIQKACVFLYSLQKLWPAAVDLALTFDIKLAKETASKPRDEKVKTKLWLKIAYHEIKDTNDVKKALDLLKECDLHIEDLLPFFSDFEKIDDFKEPICQALKDYNHKLQELQHDMEDVSKQAERVQSDLQNLRENCIRIEVHEQCNCCDTYLLVKPFFIFACGHKFHADCLEKLVVPHLSSEQARKLTMLKQQLENMLAQSAAMADKSNESQYKREKVKQEIEEILAADCVYCGLMIETIDQPFVEDWDQVNVDWE
uniref:Vacuolar protein sorting-associated protein 18 homolog n=1 Tax=Stomoxys calcitrans TaxID=35570 RepID=A0A1I8PFA3_STOCA